MNITITKDNLLSLLGICGSVAKSHSTQPYLECVKLTAADGKLSGYATDLVRDISTFVECADVKDAGIAVVNARALTERIKTMPAGPISASVSSDTLTLKSGRRKHILRCLSADYFPNLATGHTPIEVQVPTALMRRLIECSRHSAMNDFTRPHLSGVFIAAQGGNMRALASDGHRGTVVIASWTGPDLAFLLPIESLGTIAAVLTEESVKISVGPSHVLFRSSTSALGTQLPTGVFPESVILTAPGVSAPPDFTAVVDRRTFADALKSVQTASPESERGVVGMAITSGTLTVQASSKHGEADDVLDVEYSGPEATIWVNADWMLDAMKVIDTEQIRVGFAGDFGIILLRPIEGQDHIQIVMPCHL